MFGDVMKKYLWLYLIIITLFFTGCGKAEEYVANINYDHEYYETYMSYKEGAANNFILTAINNNLDVEEIEVGLMNLAKNYFKVNNSYIQAGQYLSSDKIKKLLSHDFLNKTDNIVIDGVEITPKYISSIYEQNFLAGNGNLKGIAIALILNNYQEYKNSYGNVLYKQIDENIILEFGKVKAQELLVELRKIDQLKDIRIMIGLYLVSAPNSTLPGTYKYVGITKNEKIEFTKLNYQYYYLNDQFVFNNDLNTYNAFQNLKTEINNYFKQVYPVGKGLYVDNKLVKIDIDINSNYISNIEIIYLTDLIANNISKNFDLSVYIKSNVNLNKEKKAIVVKESGTNNTNINILGG